MTPECAELIRNIIDECGYLSTGDVWTTLYPIYYNGDDVNYRSELFQSFGASGDFDLAPITDCTFYMFVLLSEGYPIV